VHRDVIFHSARLAGLRFFDGVIMACFVGDEIVPDDAGASNDYDADAVARQIVVATIDFAVAEIKKSLGQKDPGVASSIDLLNTLSLKAAREAESHPNRPLVQAIPAAMTH